MYPCSTLQCIHAVHWNKFFMTVLQVKRGICVWLAWALSMKRPGRENELSSAYTVRLANNRHQTNHLELHEYTHLGSRSLTSNTTEEDDYSLPCSPSLNGTDFSHNRIREVSQARHCPCTSHLLLTATTTIVTTTTTITTSSITSYYHPQYYYH